jgi:uncharacterized membrane protein
LTRVIALSDALFAIVLTLLVLDLQPEGARAGATLTYDDLVALWPRLFAFFLTFLVGGSFWVDHHTDLEELVDRDRSLLWLNLMFLLSVSLLPFTTALIGRDLDSTVWTLYAINMICIGLSLTALWAYANLAGFARPSLRGPEFRFGLGGHLIVPLIFVVSIPIGLVSPQLAPLPAILLPFAFRLYRLFGAHRRAEPRRGLAVQVWVYVGYLPLILFALWSVVLRMTGRI